MERRAACANGAYFSPGADTQHNAKYEIFEDRGTAERGPEDLSGIGMSHPPSGRTEGAIESGNAGAPFESMAVPA